MKLVFFGQISEDDLESPVTFADLLVFVTGADCIPPLGFPVQCTVSFYSQEEGSRRLPSSSTCALTLYLPRGVTEENDFRALMSDSLTGSYGFGKV